MIRIEELPYPNHRDIDGDKRFQQLIRSQILSKLQFRGYTFCGLVEVVDGIFPTEVRKMLDSLADAGTIIKEEETYLLVDLIEKSTKRIPSTLAVTHRTSTIVSQEVNSILPDPHPAEYDWRFTASCRQDIVVLLESYARGSSTIALLGAPSLYPLLIKRDTRTTLIDKSETLVKDLKSSGFSKGLMVHDLFLEYPKLNNRFDVIIADPPWYNEFYEAFLLRANDFLLENGYVLISVLPWLTRPTAINDRKAIIHFAMKVGFDLVEVRPRFFRYESPKFEQITLARHDIQCHDWRSGDLFIFRKIGEPRERIVVLPPKDEPRWEEFRIGHLRIKLRQDSDKDPKSLDIHPVLKENQVYNSVSRRSPHRRSIDLWTSDNVAYSLDGIQIVRECLRLLEEGAAVDSIVELKGSKYFLNDRQKMMLTKMLGEIADVG